jgi:glycosyltransferase involved in cell wall biosynthesis
MKILVITQYFWPESFRINDLVLGLKERGHHLEVLTGMPNYPEGRFYDGYGIGGRSVDFFDGIRVRRVPIVPRGSGNGFRLTLNFLSFATVACVFSPIYRKEAYDVILVYQPSPITVGLPALLLKFLNGAPIVFWMQDLWPESLSATGAVRSKPILKIAELVTRFICRGCDRILVQSKAFIPSVVKLGTDPKRVNYFPNSAESYYKPMRLSSSARESKLMPKGFRVTFAGNIGAAQDFPTILMAALKLKVYKEIQWVILGDGRFFQWVDKQIAHYNLQSTMHLLGRHPATTMPMFFSLSDALLVTLKNDHIFSLTLPSKLQSYLACGKPIIAALNGEGARIIAEANAGITCAAEDPSALAEAVLKLYKMNRSERESLGANGRIYFEKQFERECLINRLELWLLELKREVN